MTSAFVSTLLLLASDQTFETDQFRNVPQHLVRHRENAPTVPPAPTIQTGAYDRMVPQQQIRVSCKNCAQTTLLPAAAFCAYCGVKLHDTPREVVIQGLRERSGEDLKFGEDDWDWLRAQIASVNFDSAVKEEQTSSEEEPDQLISGNGNAISILEGVAENVWALQESIGRRFQNGAPIQKLIDQLDKNKVDPMTDDFLIINVGVASLRVHGYRRRFTRYVLHRGS